MNNPDSRLSLRGFRSIDTPVHLILSFAVMLGLSYILGRHLLVDPLVGKQIGIDLARLEWLNLHFPSLPFWYAQEGGGTPLIGSTPILSYYLVVVLHRLSGLSIPQAYRLISFGAIPVTALGIYVLGCLTSRRKTVGALASVFYLLSPVAWNWTYAQGFFTLGVGLVFMPVAILAFERYYFLQIANKSTSSRRIWVVRFVVSFCLAFLSDLAVARAIVLVCALYAILNLSMRRGFDLNATLGRTLGAVLRPGMLSLLVLAFFLVPFLRNDPLMAGGSELSSRIDHSTTPHILQIIGILALPSADDLLRVQFPLAVIILFLLGTIESRRFYRKLFPLALIAVFGLAVLILAPLQGFPLRMPAGLDAYLNRSSWLLSVSVLAPVVAGSGALAFSKMLLKLWDLIRGVQPRKLNSLALGPRGRELFTSLLAIVISIAALATMGSISTGKPTHLAYGPRGEGLDLGDVWNGRHPEGRRSFFDLQELENWAAFSLNGGESLEDEVSRLASFFPEDMSFRIDSSPNLESKTAGAVALLPVSQISNGDSTRSLIAEGREYQENVFYSRDLGIDEYGNPQSLNGLAQWFGTNFVFLDPEDDPREIYDEAGWELVQEEADFLMWQSPVNIEPASLSTRPVVLVTENADRKIFSTVFRLANESLLPYEEAFLVEGEKSIDSYSVQDLQPFDAVFLVGFDYQRRSRAWETLGAYVEQGGSLFVDTGWQFAVAEWEFKKAPDVLPVARLEWTEYGMGMDYHLDQPEVAGDVDVAKFKPLDWEGEAWRLSGAWSSDVRDWGEVVLSFGERPLIVAGHYGQGRVIWSGMNLMGHAMYLGNNDEELGLLHNLIGWLIDGSETQELSPPNMIRESPDQVTFQVGATTAETTWLYWREAYHPNWIADLSDSAGRHRVPVFQAGPGFMLMPLSSSSGDGVVSLNWKPSLLERGAVWASFAGILFVVALFIDGLVAGGVLLAKVKEVAIERIPRPFLGHGSNQEWAEQKRAELALGLAGEEPSELDSDPAATEESSQPSGPVEAVSEAAEHRRTENIEALAGEEDLADFGPLLENMDHPEDEWAEKALRKARTA